MPSDGATADWEETAAGVDPAAVWARGHRVVRVAGIISIIKAASAKALLGNCPTCVLNISLANPAVSP